MGITPSFAHVVFPLKDPHILQLGTIGGQASINYRADILVKVPGIRGNMYVDIANFDRYDMIIGTPFMRANKVILDFESNVVIANGVVTPARRVVLDEADGRLRRYRSTDKKQG